MSDAHNEHQSGIKTPKQLIAAVAAGFLVPIVCIVLLVEFVTSEPKEGAGSSGQTAASIEARIKPVADDGFTFRDANAPKVLMTGEQVYSSTCVACAWGKRISEGFDTLVSHAIKGFNAMPAKGGNPDLDDIEIARTVAFMANQAGAKFKAPDPKPAAPATADAAAPAAPAAK